MIKITCLPNYIIFRDLNTVGLIPSTFLLGRHSHPLTKLEENRSNVSWAVDSIVLWGVPGFPNLGGSAWFKIWEELWGGGGPNSQEKGRYLEVTIVWYLINVCNKYV